MFKRLIVGALCVMVLCVPAFGQTSEPAAKQKAADAADNNPTNDKTAQEQMLSALGAVDTAGAYKFTRSLPKQAILQGMAAQLDQKQTELKKLREWRDQKLPVQIQEVKDRFERDRKQLAVDFADTPEVREDLEFRAKARLADSLDQARKDVEAAGERIQVLTDEIASLQLKIMQLTREVEIGGLSRPPATSGVSTGTRRKLLTPEERDQIEKKYQDADKNLSQVLPKGSNARGKGELKK